jgi:hypothetical protein
MTSEQTLAQVIAERDDARRIAKDVFEYLYPMLTKEQRETSEAVRAKDLIRTSIMPHERRDGSPDPHHGREVQRPI